MWRRQTMLSTSISPVSNGTQRSVVLHLKYFQFLPGCNNHPKYFIFLGISLSIIRGACSIKNYSTKEKYLWKSQTLNYERKSLINRWYSLRSLKRNVLADSYSSGLCLIMEHWGMIRDFRSCFLHQPKTSQCNSALFEWQSRREEQWTGSSEEIH